jgi:hypothetical protein
VCTMIEASYLSDMEAPAIYEDKLVRITETFSAGEDTFYAGEEYFVYWYTPETNTYALQERDGVAYVTTVPAATMEGRVEIIEE